MHKIVFLSGLIKKQIILIYLIKTKNFTYEFVCVLIMFVILVYTELYILKKIKSSLFTSVIYKLNQKKLSISIYIFILKINILALPSSIKFMYD